MPSLRKILAAPIITSSVLLLSANSCAVGAAIIFAEQAPAAPRPGDGPGPDAWGDAVRELAARIVSRIGVHATLTLTVRNLSSLGADEASEVRSALRAELRHQGVRLVVPEQAQGRDLTAPTAKRGRPDRAVVTLSENVQGYLWVAEIRPSRVKPEDSGTPEVVMLEVMRSGKRQPVQAPTSLALRKSLVWEQDGPILDFAAVEPSGSVSLVLSLSKISLVRRRTQPGLANEAAAQTEPSILLPHTRPWPRDPRGRLVIGPDHSFDAYLPGVKCRGNVQTDVTPALTLDCQDADDAWPVGSGVARVGLVTGRNFFDGRLTTSDGKGREVPPFFSAAELPSQEVLGKSGPLWVFGGLDGRVRVTINGSGLAAFEGWGSDLAPIKADCAHSWLVLSDTARESIEPDAVRAYEIARGEAVAASPAVDFAGPVTALWSEGDGSSALAVSRNLETGRYEAYSLSISCGQ
jgi:hypothetical protein